ncbi:hypothetical protein CYMTET_35165 [Cymbomonas tetramitiformis]|uniref:Uncharacterized protein n=1 Tax=Cymbomonas tetramitiformis TaxID=36881 RepID=A0AAE0FA41_9CHLO|nr:hypothetical protein CYMTET_35165 [Cymbomonas tetramitiformis]
MHLLTRIFFNTHQVCIMPTYIFGRRYGFMAVAKGFGAALLGTFFVALIASQIDVPEITSNFNEIKSLKQTLKERDDRLSSLEQEFEKLKGMSVQPPPIKEIRDAISERDGRLEEMEAQIGQLHHLVNGENGKVDPPESQHGTKASPRTYDATPRTHDATPRAHDTSSRPKADRPAGHTYGDYDYDVVDPRGIPYPHDHYEDAASMPPAIVLPPDSQHALLDEQGCSSGQVWEEELGKCLPMLKLDRVSAITPAEFELKYYKPARPVILTNITAQWKAYKKWSLDYFQKNYGDVDIQVQKGRSERKDFETAQHALRRRMKFREYVDLIKSSNVTNDMYMTSNNDLMTKAEIGPNLVKDMQPFFPGFFFVDMTNIHFWLGPKGTMTPLHYDPISLMHTHVFGRKVWRMIPPECRPYIYNTDRVYTDVDALNFDYKKYPLLKHVWMITETIQPGETLFVPNGWWHHVAGIDKPTISVSFTSWNPRFAIYEKAHAKKWPMKVRGKFQQMEEPQGPATPGEKTPVDFNIWTWLRDQATRQRENGYPWLDFDWSGILLKDPEEVSKETMLEYSTQGGPDGRTVALVWTALNPQCSEIPFDWMAWMIENVGLNSGIDSLAATFVRETLPMVRVDHVKAIQKCLSREQEAFSEHAMDEIRPQVNSVMQRIREAARKVKAQQKEDVKDLESKKKKWIALRHTNGWEPPSEAQMMSAESHPTARPLAAQPRTVLLEGLIRPEVARRLIELAIPGLVRSTTISDDSSSIGQVNSARTSMGAWLNRNDPTVVEVLGKVSEVVGSEANSHEEYRQHLDCCDSGGPFGHMEPACEIFIRSGGDRIASMIFMLQEPEEGGATGFPRAHRLENGQVVPTTNRGEMRTCTSPDLFQVKPKVGDALLFWDYLSAEKNKDGMHDYAAEHMGCPVKQGQKWIATVWVRGARF